MSLARKDTLKYSNKCSNCTKYHIKMTSPHTLAHTLAQTQNTQSTHMIPTRLSTQNASSWNWTPYWGHHPPHFNPRIFCKFKCHCWVWRMTDSLFDFLDSWTQPMCRTRVQNDKPAYTDHATSVCMNMRLYAHLHTNTYFARPIGHFCLPNFAKIANSSYCLSLMFIRIPVILGQSDEYDSSLKLRKRRKKNFSSYFGFLGKI